MVWIQIQRISIIFAIPPRTTPHTHSHSINGTLALVQERNHSWDR